jgi:hypothetical protein
MPTPNVTAYILFSYYSHQVALEADEVDPHGDGSVRVATQSFDSFHQVGGELVATLQYTQHHQVVVSKIIHDVAGKPLGPS